jgi:hypothetical protein
VSKNPYKFTAVKREKFIKLLADGSRRGTAAQAVGISRAQVCNYAKDNPQFALAMNEAEMESNEPVEDALYQAALSGNVVAIQVWLYNRMPDRWADRRKVDLKHEGELNVTTSPRDEINRRISSIASAISTEKDT